MQRKTSQLTATTAFAALFFASPAIGQSEPNAQGDLAITIYNDGQALVQDIRQINITQGRSRIEFPDVSAQIRAETLSFSAANTAIIEQNFDFDLLTPAKLIEKAIGQTVTLVRTNTATGAEQRQQATVLSTAGGTVVQIGDKIEVLRDDGLPVRVIFDGVPPNLRARPTLSVTLDSARGGTRPASIRYLTGGLGWNADYVALFDDAKGTVDMQGWVTLTNQTGTTFNNAKLLLVMGNPGGAGGSFGQRSAGRGIEDIGTETAARERLGDFYLYPIEARTTIANAQTKQVSFLDVQGVPARKIYARTVGALQSDGQPVNAASKIAFSSSSQGGLGDALPQGAVRFYQRDGQGSPQFIGESAIPHTPMGSTLALTTGDAFDITTQAEIESREKITAAQWEASARYRVLEDDRVVREVEVSRPVDFHRTTMRYTITNGSSVPVEVELTQAGLYRGWWSRDYRIIHEDITGEQLGIGERTWTVPVPANGKREVRVTFETRY